MSSKKIALDSGVVIALGDLTDVHHEMALSAVAAARGPDGVFVVSAITYCEAMVVAARLGRRQLDAAVRLLQDLCQTTIEVNGEIGIAAAKLRGKHAWLTTTDALIVASADEFGATELLTTDRRLARLKIAKYVGA